VFDFDVIANEFKLLPSPKLRIPTIRLQGDVND
jgi:hypothetical protein